MELSDIRLEIDRIDEGLVRLFTARMDAVGRIAQAKKQTGGPISDPERERDIVDRLCAQAGDKYAPYVRALYERLFELSRGYQSDLLLCASSPEGKRAGTAAGTTGGHLPGCAGAARQHGDGPSAMKWNGEPPEEAPWNTD